MPVITGGRGRAPHMVVKTLVGLHIRVGRDGRLHAKASITVEGVGGFHYVREQEVAATLTEIVTWVTALLA